MSIKSINVGRAHSNTLYIIWLKIKWIYSFISQHIKMNTMLAPHIIPAFSYNCDIE